MSSARGDMASRVPGGDSSVNGLYGEYDVNCVVLFPFIAISVGNFIDAGMTSGAYRKLLNIKD